MKNFNIYDVYKTLLNALKTIYIGELYLSLEKIEQTLDYFEDDDVLALDVMSYEIKGRYGRVSDKELDDKEVEFSLKFYPEDTLDVLRAKFIDNLLK